MKLVRIFVCRLETALKEDATITFKGTQAAVQMELLGQRREGRWAVVALGVSVQLDSKPERLSSGFLRVPKQVVHILDEAFRLSSNLAAVERRCARSNSVGRPILAAAAESAEEQEYLDSSAGFDFEVEMIPSLTAPLSGDQVRPLLVDRADGVDLLAEALSNQDPTGRFHELVRVFERAFKTKPSKLCSTMLPFLSSTPFGYLESELDRWFDELRNPAVHATLPGQLIFGVDTRKVVGRMEQAAYDVLHNKANWGDRTLDRRRLWVPDAYTSSADGDCHVLVGCEDALNAQLLDPFCGLPVDLSSSVPISDSWWIGPRRGKTKKFELTMHRDRTW